MNLRRWLKANKITQKEFGEMIGRSEMSVYYILSARRVPGIRTAKKILEVTKGEVTFEDLYSTIEYKEEVLDIL